MLMDLSRHYGRKMDGDGVGMGTDVMGMGWVWGEQFVPVQLSIAFLLFIMVVFVSLDLCGWSETSKLIG